MKGKSLSHVQLLVIPWIAAYQAPPSIGFARQEYWSRVPLPSPVGLHRTIQLELLQHYWLGHRIGLLWYCMVCPKITRAFSFSSRDVIFVWFFLLTLELTPPKDVHFFIGDWNAKWGSQELPGVTGKFSLGVQNEAGQRLTEFCQENAWVIANTLFQQHKRRLYTWTSPDGQYQNQTDYILSSQRWRSSIQSVKTRPGADCGSDHEILIDKFRLKLKKNATILVWPK